MPLLPLRIVWVYGLDMHKIEPRDMVRTLRDVGGYIEIGGWAPPRVAFAHVQWPAEPWRISLRDSDGHYHEVMSCGTWTEALTVAKRCARRDAYAVLDGEDWRPSADVGPKPTEQARCRAP